MKRTLTVTFVFILSAFLTGCTDDVLTPSRVEDRSSDHSGPEAVSSRYSVSPHTVLSRSALSEVAGPAAKSNSKGEETTGAGEFASPLFGLATAPNGDILVAESGAGVATLTGVTDIPLPGITDMSPLGRSAMWATKGLTGAPGDDTGQAIYRASKGKTRLIADLFAFEKTNNPDGKSIDSNPFDVQSLGGRAALVADAGGNDLLRVDNQGNIEVVAVFPDEPVSTANIKELAGCPDGPSEICGLPTNQKIPAQPVPTSIAVGPDGYYYVGELKGFPAPTGASNIWRIAPDASGAVCGESSPDCVKVFDGGFTSIIDLKFDDSGTLHVAELDEKSWFAVEFSPSALAGGTINACDIDEGSCTEVATGIPILTAITFGDDGTLWATKNALIPESAEVVEIP